MHEGDDAPAPDIGALWQAIAAEPDVAAHHAALAAALHGLGLHDDAAAEYERAIAIGREQLAVLHANLGATLIDAARLPDAAAAYEAALVARPGWALAHQQLAAVRWGQGDRAAAATHFAAALAAEPAHAAAAHGLSVALAALGRLDDAIAAAERTREIEPRWPGLDGELALLYLRVGDAATALPLAERACAQAPDDPAPHGVRGAALVRLGRPADALAAYAAARACAPERVEVHVNYALGAEAVGDVDGAAASYRAALERDPANLAALLHLARLLADHGREDELAPVRDQLRAIDPDNAMTPHLLDALRGVTTARAPRDYVVALFDDSAERFDELLTGHLGYRVPEQVAATLARLDPTRRFARAIDLGCGTGLSGAAVRDRCDALVGVDLAPRMLERARDRGVYDALHQADVVEFLDGRRDRYDLVIATDVLIYLGELAPLVAAIARRLTPGGWFAASVERSDDADVALRATGRYAHGRGYVEGLAARHGLRIAAFDPIDVRLEAGGRIAGWLFVLAAPLPATPARGSERHRTPRRR